MAGRGASGSGTRSRRARASASTATTTSTASARRRSPSSCCASSAPTSSGTCRAGSRRATASRGETLARLADEGVGLVLTVDCGITAVDEVAEARRRGLEVDRHGSPPTGRRAARLPDRRHAPVRLSVPGALRHRRRPQARLRRCSAPTIRRVERAPRPRRPGDDRRRRAARRREPRARDRGPARVSPRRTRPGLQALMRERARRSGRRRRGRGRIPAGAADQRRRPPRRPDVALELSSPRTRPRRVVARTRSRS